MLLNNDFYVTLHKYFISKEFDCSNRLNAAEYKLFKSKFPDFNQLYDYYRIKLEKQIISDIYKDINILINEVIKK